MEVCVLQNDQAVCRVIPAAEAAPAKAAAAAKARPAAAVPPRDEQVVIELDLDGGVARQVALDLLMLCVCVCVWWREDTEEDRGKAGAGGERGGG